jgi:hypothetical protein
VISTGSLIKEYDRIARSTEIACGQTEATDDFRYGRANRMERPALYCIITTSIYNRFLMMCLGIFRCIRIACHYIPYRNRRDVY